MSIGGLVDVALTYGTLGKAAEFGRRQAEFERGALMQGALARGASVRALEGEVQGIRSMLEGLAPPVVRELSPMPSVERVERPKRGVPVINPWVALASALGGGGVLGQYLSGAQSSAERLHQDELEEWRSLVSEAAERHERAMRLWEYGERLKSEQADRGERWTDRRLGLMAQLAGAEGKASEARAVAMHALSEAELRGRALEASAVAGGMQRISDRMERRYEQSAEVQEREQRHQQIMAQIGERGEQTRKTESVKAKNASGLEEVRQRGRLALQSARDLAAAIRSRNANAVRLQIARIRASSGGTSASTGIKSTAGERLAEQKDALRLGEYMMAQFAGESKRLANMRSWPLEEIKKQYPNGGRDALEAEISRNNRDAAAIAKWMKEERARVKADQVRAIIGGGTGGAKRPAGKNPIRVRFNQDGSSEVVR